MAKVAELIPGRRVFVVNHDPCITTQRLYGVVVAVNGRKALLKLEDGRNCEKDCSSLKAL